MDRMKEDNWVEKSIAHSGGKESWGQIKEDMGLGSERQSKN